MRLRAAFLVLLFVVTGSRDINRPYYGLHGYGEAHAAWAARAHLHYGLGYTHGVGTFAVGNPPETSPERYLNHPPLPFLLDAVVLKLLGEHERSLRIAALVVYALCIPLLLTLLTRLYDERTATLATLIFVLVPITGYFYMMWDFWQLPLVLGALWSYLAMRGRLRDADPNRGWLRLLGACLFFSVQMGWASFFFAAAIGLHYVAACIRDRSNWRPNLFFTLLLAPLGSFALALLFLTAAAGWDGKFLIQQLHGRSSAIAIAGRTWGGWVRRQVEMVTWNYGAVIAVLALLQLPLSLSGRRGQGFKYWWLFIAPGVLTMLAFTELFWEHHFWYWPFSLGVSIAAALTLLRIHDAVAQRMPRALWGVTALLALVIVAESNVRRDDFYDGRQFSPLLLERLARLRSEIPADGALLGSFNYVYKDQPATPQFYRPEVAWALDRRITPVLRMVDIEASARAGYPYYLATVPSASPALLDSLRARYEFEHFPGRPVDLGPPYMSDWPDSYLFDLRRPATPEGRAGR